MSLDVPTAVMQGDSIWLNCTLDLESDDLYSVKWYKDDVEFYRHLPQDSPSGQKYDIPGIRLDPTDESEIPVDPKIATSNFFSSSYVFFRRVAALWRGVVSEPWIFHGSFSLSFISAGL
ncbi:hypothetical protein CDAR_426651 [Caerostris darwini]|uniref:Ig-like domain-containing protein n=1 Tax=Caerostris darwini TaxID=1538125 RepID=A0AAV4NA17_9ARAC|nr:hypothetical protein CDAR_426651 [Caerostris darwini]